MKPTAIKLFGGKYYPALLRFPFNLLAGKEPASDIRDWESISFMWLLVSGRRKVGRKLNSAPILADANCSLVCIYMSVVLLVSSLAYQFTGFGFIDSLGALGLIYFSISEGREAFEKAANVEDDCCSDD